MNLTNTQIEDTYGNLLTIGTTAGSPQEGKLQNGAGEDVTSLTVQSIKYSQKTVAATGTSLATAAQLEAGVSLITSADASNIAIKLPAPVIGTSVKVVNTSTRSIEVYPYASTGSVLGLSAGDAYVIPNDGQMYEFVCVQNPNVGVWVVIAPATASSPATLLYTNDITVDVNSPTSGGVRSATGGVGGIVGSVSSAYSGGTVISRELVLGSNSAGIQLLDWSKLAAYSEYRVKRFTVKTNVPAGDLTQNASQVSNTLMGLTTAQFGTMKIIHRSLYWDDTYLPVTTNQTYSINTLTAIFPNTYSYNYVQNNAPASYQSYKHYIASPSDLAYNASHANNRYLKYENVVPTQPSNVANGFNTSIYAWSRMFDDNGNPIVYHMFNLIYGDSTDNSNAFPSGFELKGTFELEIEVR
jgi:hypothetical protein